MININFKSTFHNFWNERNGYKNNTVRIKPLFIHDKRFCILDNLAEGSKYNTINGATITIRQIKPTREVFIRSIRHVCIYNYLFFKIYIITWRDKR